jgi:alkylation response protein AidB-like acyl-CoA dehydrogenase
MSDTSYLQTVDEIAADVVAEQARRVDREAAFPEASVAALREAGLFGLISAAEVGGMGQGPRALVEVIERLARECGSTAMVMCMHYAGTAVIEKLGPEAVRRQIAAGEHLSTLAFSEVGSRSQFWAPVGTARRDGDGIRLDARKSWVTSANHATAYVWSSKPVAAEALSSIWLVPAGAAGLSPVGRFEGLGLRGNDSTPVHADGVIVSEADRLGDDGGGFAIMLEVVLPYFNAMTAACSVGFMEAATARTAAHVGAVRYEHHGGAIADLPTVRNYLARMRVKTDMARALLLDTVDALERGRPDAVLRVLECKAAAGETANEVLDLAMRVCAGAAFRGDVAVERYFRDARAQSVMAPTTDVLYDFIGKAVCGMDLF